VKKEPTEKPPAPEEEEKEDKEEMAEVPTDAASMDPDNIMKLNVGELKAVLQNYGRPIYGNKATLRARMLDYIAEEKRRADELAAGGEKGDKLAVAKTRGQAASEAVAGSSSGEDASQKNAPDGEVAMDATLEDRLDSAEPGAPGAEGGEAEEPQNAEVAEGVEAEEEGSPEEEGNAGQEV